MDGNMSGEERSRVDGHLNACSDCRRKLTDFQELRQSLRVLARPAIPAGVANSVKLAVAAEMQATSRRESSVLHTWINTWLMPSSAGAFASLMVAFFVLWTLHSASNGIAQKPSAISAESLLLANANANSSPDEAITALSLAQERVLVAGESPSINPNGALVALTKSLVRGEMKDDEVVVVADVFGNGLAQISEVVEPSHDQRAVAELEQALKSDPAYAPFVPANLDGRSDSVRVVLKIQSVDVKTNLKPKRK